MKTRPVTKEDLKDFKFEPSKCCNRCDFMGSYRTTDFYLCEKCMYDMVRLEVEEDED